MSSGDIDRLQRALEALARATTYPPAPPLADAIRRRIESAPRIRGPASRWAIAAVSLAATLVAIFALIALAAPARQAIADVFDRINIFSSNALPTGLPTEISGEALSLTQAKASVDFPILLPADIPGPSRLVLQEFDSAQVLFLFFEPPNGKPFLLVETNAIVGKGLPLETGATSQPVAGFPAEAYWIRGVHTVELRDDQGNAIPKSARLTGENTLIWNQGGFVFRVEGDLSLEEAVRIARSLR